MAVEGLSISVNGLGVKYVEFARRRLAPWGEESNHIALNEVSFEVGNGETIGIIGRNGSGKSTLLKCVSGLLRPSEGKIITTGRVILLAGVNPGFSNQISGRKNVFELAQAYGVSKDEIDSFVLSVEEFADIGDAFDRNFGGYSTGMRGKVGFGFITALEPDILLIDETLGVGDREFRAKAQIRLREFISRSGTVLISTHSLGLAKELCDRGLIIDNGRIVFDGEIESSIKHYMDITE